MDMHITDKTGRKFFRVSVAARYSDGEYNNLMRHLRNIRSGSPAYTGMGIDAESALISTQLDQFDLAAATKFNTNDISDDELLVELNKPA